MKTSYDVSFLNSSKNPRQDNWIGQPFVLSYLLSEPGTNFMFRYQPYSLNHSRITKDQIYAARKVEKEGDRVGTYEDGIVRRDHRGIKQTERPRVEVHRVLEAITQHGFQATLEDAEAIVDSLLFVEKHTKETGSEYERTFAEIDIIDKFVNPVIMRNNIRGSRAEHIKDTVLHIYRIFSLDTKRRGQVSLLETMQRIEETSEAIRMGQYILNQMDIMNDAIKGGYSLGLRDSDHEGTEKGNYVNSDKADKYVSMNEVLLAIRQRENIGHKQPGYKNGAPSLTQFESILLEDALKGVKPDIHAKEYLPTVNVEKKITLEGHEQVGSLSDSKHALEGHIIEDDTLYAYGVSQLSAGLLDTLNIAWLGRGKEARLPDDTFADLGRNKEIRSENFTFAEMQKSAGARIDTSNILADDKKAMESRITTGDEKLAGHHGRDAGKGDYNKVALFDEKVAKDSANNQPYFFIDEIVNKEAWLYDDFFYVDEKIDKDARITEQDITFIDKQKSFDGWVIKDNILRLDLLPVDAWIIEDPTTKVDKMEKVAWIVNDIVTTNLMIDEKIDGGAWIEQRFHYFDLVKKDARPEQDLIERLEKVSMAAWIRHMVRMVSRREKASLLGKHWQSVSKNFREAYEIEENIRQQISTLMDKEAKAGRVIDDVEKVIKESKPALIIQELMADEVRLDGMFTKILELSDRPDAFSSAVQKVLLSPEQERRSFTLTEMNFGDRETQLALVEELINANDDTGDNGRDAMIVEGHFLIQDQSDWEDIWNKRVTGVDILDPPDSDFDYSKLASQVYNLDTGVPYKPMSPTNVADVRVRTPLHHPMPEHFDIGIDDSRELIVDNQIFRDVVLAIESLKFRNKLRYAGMPAEKAMRDLFSKLFSWIQEANPDSAEYKRMFRFARWYAESAVLRLSEHILHRVYNSWVSEMNKGTGLGTKYSQKGWFYFAPAYAMQTQSTKSVLSFEKENYIDGQIILMGYFDNPLSQGTMELRVDGEVVDTWNTKGAFKRVIELEQGSHNYDIVFTGDSGTVSLSRIEITGCEFVSAHTTSDDSNTNGLKAIQTLIDMLLSYFELHHGDDKIKGTMEVKQRRVWNTQT